MTHPRAVIFDLDGTLADSEHDFDAMRAEIGLRPGIPILEQLAECDDALRAVSYTHLTLPTILLV